MIIKEITQYKVPKIFSQTSFVCKNHVRICRGFLARNYESHKYCPDVDAENHGSYHDESVDDERKRIKGEGTIGG